MLGTVSLCTILGLAIYASQPVFAHNTNTHKDIHHYGSTFPQDPNYGFINGVNWKIEGIDSETKTLGEINNLHKPPYSAGYVDIGIGYCDGFIKSYGPPRDWGNEGDCEKYANQTGSSYSDRVAIIQKYPYQASTFDRLINQQPYLLVSNAAVGAVNIIAPELVVEAYVPKSAGNFNIHAYDLCSSWWDGYASSPKKTDVYIKRISSSNKILSSGTGGRKWANRQTQAYCHGPYTGTGQIGAVDDHGQFSKSANQTNTAGCAGAEEKSWQLPGESTDTQYCVYDIIIKASGTPYQSQFRLGISTTGKKGFLRMKNFKTKIGDSGNTIEGVVLSGRIPWSDEAYIGNSKKDIGENKWEAGFIVDPSVKTNSGGTTECFEDTGGPRTGELGVYDLDGFNIRAVIETKSREDYFSNSGGWAWERNIHINSSSYAATNGKTISKELDSFFEREKIYKITFESQDQVGYSNYKTMTVNNYIGFEIPFGPPLWDCESDPREIELRINEDCEIYATKLFYHGDHDNDSTTAKIEQALQYFRIKFLSNENAQDFHKDGGSWTDKFDTIGSAEGAVSRVIAVLTNLKERNNPLRVFYIDEVGFRDMNRDGSGDNYFVLSNISNTTNAGGFISLTNAFAGSGTKFRPPFKITEIKLKDGMLGWPDCSDDKVIVEIYNYHDRTQPCIIAFKKLKIDGQDRSAQFTLDIPGITRVWPPSLDAGYRYHDKYIQGDEDSLGIEQRRIFTIEQPEVTLPSIARWDYYLTAINGTPLTTNIEAEKGSLLKSLETSDEDLEGCKPTVTPPHQMQICNASDPFKIYEEILPRTSPIRWATYTDDDIDLGSDEKKIMYDTQGPSSTDSWNDTRCVPGQVRSGWTITTTCDDPTFTGPIANCPTSTTTTRTPRMIPSNCASQATTAVYYNYHPERSRIGTLEYKFGEYKMTDPIFKKILEAIPINGHKRDTATAELNGPYRAFIHLKHNSDNKINTPLNTPISFVKSGLMNTAAPAAPPKIDKINFLPEADADYKHTAKFTLTLRKLNVVPIVPSYDPARHTLLLPPRHSKIFRSDGDQKLEINDTPGSRLGQDEIIVYVWTYIWNLSVKEEIELTYKTWNRGLRKDTNSRTSGNPRSTTGRYETIKESSALPKLLKKQLLPRCVLAPW